MPKIIIVSREEVDKICLLYKEGISMGKLMELFNRTQHTVRKILTNNNFQIRNWC